MNVKTQSEAIFVNFSKAKDTTMKLLHSMLFSLLMCMAVAVHAEDKDAQVKPLMDKITAALKADRASEALPYMAQLEGMELDLSYPLPESFYYYYIDTLDKTGDKDEALSRGKIYLKKYGQNGKHYSQVSEIVNRSGAFVMVRIPGKNYEMGKYEVTQKEWQVVMVSNPSDFKSCGDTCPVEQVSWDDIQIFLQKLNTKTGRQYRMPTEAEWEYACYGGSQSEYCGSNDINAVAWYDSNSNNSSHPVGQKQANGYGLYDMSGNVWEWMSDCWEGDCAKRVLRGGSWSNIPQNVRSAIRYDYEAAIRFSYFGFRLARTLP